MAVTEVNKCEEEVKQFNPALLEFVVPSFYYSIDNKLIDVYFANRTDVFCDDEKDKLELDEFLHFTRNINRDLEYLLHLKFTHFWGMISKVAEISKFIDEFLQSMRKHNDIFKLQHVTQYYTNPSFFSNSEDKQLHDEIRGSINKMLDIVLKLYFRMSMHQESDEEYFSVGFYAKMIYDNWIFDMAKLIDIPAIYGRSNPETVQKMLLNVFDSEKRLVQDFKDTFDLMVGLLKTKFKEYQKVKSMI